MENPPAFPREDYQSDNAPGQRGMTLRDWFAAGCDQPGASEIVATAGFVWSANQVWHPDEPKTPIGSFDKWWSELPLAKRYSLYAQVRYAMADAMLAARDTERKLGAVERG